MTFDEDLQVIFKRYNVPQIIHADFIRDLKQLHNNYVGQLQNYPRQAVPMSTKSTGDTPFTKDIFDGYLDKGKPDPNARYLY